ncbi:AAA family ATPase [Microbaculum marinum]|uniref:AAA family ATPase n=1 Tax=Microbaculum marinum TaxID=1764581 RepID=A0AAW9RS54_9HYPH
MLIILGGLPGTGKTSVARQLALRLGAVHIRIDTIEQAIRDTGAAARQSMADSGYRVGYGVSGDNLAIGRMVIADSVNPIELTRAAWRAVAERAGVRGIEVEIVCSDADEHRRRIETRRPDVPGLRLPTWDDVLARRYEPWESADLVIDTAGRGLDEAVAQLVSRLPAD